MRAVKRGEVWLASLDPTEGHEQRGRRPALVLSSDIFNEGPVGLVVAAPITTRQRRGVMTRIEVRPPDGGLREVSYIMCEQIRTLSVNRLGTRPFGRVSPAVLDAVEDRLRILLDL